MGHPHAFQPEPWQVFEITTRCLQGRFFLKPDPEANRRILGVLARTLELYGDAVRVHFVAGTSNHLHIIASTRDSLSRARFKSHLKTNLSKELGDLYDWPEHVFGRRARDIPILDDDALLDRLRYAIAHGMKEGLVPTPLDWPGPAFLPAVLEGVALRGVWYVRSKLYRLKKAWERRSAETRGEAPDLSAVAEEKTVVLTPPPIWADLTESEVRAKWRGLYDQVVADHQAFGPDVEPLGAEVVLGQDPRHRPERMKRSPAPAVHTLVPELRRMWKAAYRAFVGGWKDAMARVREGLRPFGFPPGGVLPPTAMAVAGLTEG